MIIDLTNKAHVQKIISEIEGAESQDRRTYEWDSYNIYAGKQRQYVRNELMSILPTSYKNMTVSDINIFKKATEKKAKAYKEHPLRLINGEPSDALDGVYKNSNTAFKTMDVMFNRHKYNLMWVQNNPELNTEFNFRPLAPYTFSVVLNPNTNALDTVILHYPDIEITQSSPQDTDPRGIISDGVNQTIAESQSDSGPSKVRTYAMWTKTHHVTVQAEEKMSKEDPVTEITYIIDPSNPDMLNPIEVIPFAWVTTDPDIPEIPIESPFSLQSVDANVVGSFYLTSVNKQGMGQLILKYPEGSKIKQLHQGFDIVLELPQKEGEDVPGTDAKFINANPDLTGMKEAFMGYAEAVMSEHGVTNFSLVQGTQNFASGFDRALAMADVTEIREENISLYQTIESKLFDIVKAYDKVNGTNLFREEDQFSIVFEKPKILMSESDKLDLIQKKLDLGIIEDFEKLMIMNPLLTEDQAREKLAAIDKERMEKAKAFLPGTVNGNNKEGDNEEN